MSKIFINSNPTRELWQSALQTLSEGNLPQTFEFGEAIRQAFPRTELVRLVALDRDKSLGVLQGAYSKYLGFGMRVKIVNGPFVTQENKQIQLVVNEILSALETYCKENRIIAGEIWLPEHWEFVEILRGRGYKLTGKINEYIVDVNKPAEKLWQCIHHNKRRNIKKAMKEGVQIVQSSHQQDVPLFYKLLKASSKRRGFPIYPFSWFETIWNLCASNSTAQMFFAKWKGKTLAGVFTVRHGKTLYAVAAGSLSEGWKVRPNDLLHWKVMEWACNQRMHKYHMGYVVDPLPTEDSEAWGIWRWKREWKGELKKILIFNKIFFHKYKFILKTKEIFESIYERIRKLKR